MQGLPREDGESLSKSNATLQSLNPNDIYQVVQESYRTRLSFCMLMPSHRSINSSALRTLGWSVADDHEPL